MKNKKFSSIEKIIKIAKKGGMYILVDDENRENEGDLVFCSSDVNSKKINFMAKYGRGLICLTLDSIQAKKLGLSYMAPVNQSRNQTAFTVSIEAKKGVTTGISAQDGQCGYEGCDFVGNTDDDWRGHCDANPEHCRPKAGDTCGYRHDGGDACGYVFTGNEGEEHFHCNACGAGMGSGQDMDQHCQDNPEHCRPQAGDTCGYRHDGGDACGYVFTGDEGEDHHHCDTCGAPMSSGQDMGQHCQENPDHCQGGGPGGPPFEAVDADGNGLISRDEARAMFGKDPEGNDNPNFDEEFDEIDTNGDGSVDPAEFEAGNKDDHDDNDDDENNN